MDNPETLATLGTQDTEQRQTKQKQNGTQHHTTQENKQENKKLGNTDPTKKTRGEPMSSQKVKMMPLIKHTPCYIYSQDVLVTTIRKQTQIINKTSALLQTTGDKDEPNIVVMRQS